MSTQLRIDRSATAQVVRVSAAPLLTKIEVSGAVAGLVGGVTMAVVGAILAIAMGADLWKAPKLIATFVLGLGATAGTGFVALPVIIGSLIHLALRRHNRHGARCRILKFQFGHTESGLVLCQA